MTHDDIAEAYLEAILNCQPLTAVFDTVGGRYVAALDRTGKAVKHTSLDFLLTLVDLAEDEGWDVSEMEDL